MNGVRPKGPVRDRSRAASRRLREMSRTLARPQRREKVGGAAPDRRGGQAARGVAARGARADRAGAPQSARTRGAGQAAGGTGTRWRSWSSAAGGSRTRSERGSRAKQIKDRLVSLADPDARPIRKGKQGKPTEFGYVVQIAEVTPNTKPGARGLVLSASSRPGNPAENQLLPDTAKELERLGLSPSEVALDGGFQTGPTTDALEPLAPKRTFIAGRQQPGSKRTRRRLARYITGTEGRISHLKRRYGLRRSRLKGQQTWTGWAILAYNFDTLAVRSA